MKKYPRRKSRIQRDHVGQTPVCLVCDFYFVCSNFKVLYFTRPTRFFFVADRPALLKIITGTKKLLNRLRWSRVSQGELFTVRFLHIDFLINVAHFTNRCLLLIYFLENRWIGDRNIFLRLITASFLWRKKVLRKVFKDKMKRMLFFHNMIRNNSFFHVNGSGMFYFPFSSSKITLNGVHMITQNIYLFI